MIQSYHSFIKRGLERQVKQLFKSVNVIIPKKALFQKAVAPLYAKYPEYKDLIKEIQDTK